MDKEKEGLSWPVLISRPWRIQKSNFKTLDSSPILRHGQVERPNNKHQIPIKLPDKPKQKGLIIPKNMHDVPKKDA